MPIRDSEKNISIEPEFSILADGTQTWSVGGVVNYCWSKDQQLPSNEGIIPVSIDTCLDISRDISPTEVSPQA
jgi:hypothetical protein